MTEQRRTKADSAPRDSEQDCRQDLSSARHIVHDITTKEATTHRDSSAVDTSSAEATVSSVVDTSSAVAMASSVVDTSSAAVTSRVVAVDMASSVEDTVSTLLAMIPMQSIA